MEKVRCHSAWKGNAVADCYGKVAEIVRQDWVTWFQAECSPCLCNLWNCTEWCRLDQIQWWR